MGRTTLAGDLLALAAGIGWGMTTLVIRATRLRSAPASQVLWYQLGVSAVMFFAAGTWAGDTPFVSMSGISIASVLYQMIWVTTITYGIWFVLIGRYSATNLSVITFVTPVMGVLMGHLILDEALAGNLLLAVTAVAGGILLVSLPRRSR
jgi:drug/metabolite transporter (DMT)-like permease